MNSKNRFRRLPPVCALVAVLRLLIGDLRFERRYLGRVFVMEDGQRFRVFRHLSFRGGRTEAQVSPAVFVVRFKFARFSQGLNRLLSLIPVPLIGGYPGFRNKLWMVQEETGFWQGVYEWESTEAVETYRRSFVLGVMNRRAEPGSISETVVLRTPLEDYVGGRIEQG
jgi:hypothetical protein